MDLGVAYVPITILNDLSVTMKIEYQQDFYLSRVEEMDGCLKIWADKSNAWDLNKKNMGN